MLMIVLFLGKCFFLFFFILLFFSSIPKNVAFFPRLSFLVFFSLFSILFSFHCNSFHIYTPFFCTIAHSLRSFLTDNISRLWFVRALFHFLNQVTTLFSYSDQNNTTLISCSFRRRDKISWGFFPIATQTFYSFHYFFHCRLVYLLSRLE